MADSISVTALIVAHALGKFKLKALISISEHCSRTIAYAHIQSNPLDTVFPACLHCWPACAVYVFARMEMKITHSPEHSLPPRVASPSLSPF
jgi:hypothetical protein